MKFYGIQKTTLIDYPGEVASTLFTFGCNMRCPFCHNPELVLQDLKPESISWETVKEHLVRRKHVLGGVCISGGEPLLERDLGKIIGEIHKIGLKVKIDTNGTLPERLGELQPDFIAMDIKTSLEKYSLLGYQGKGDIAARIGESIRWIMQSGIDYEFRTTLVPGIIDKEDLKKIMTLLCGAKKYALAQFRSGGTLDPSLEKIEPYSSEDLFAMKRIVENTGIPCEIRASSTL